MVQSEFVDKVKDALDAAYNYDLQKMATVADWNKEPYDLVERKKRALVVIRKLSSFKEFISNLIEEVRYLHNYILGSSRILNYFIVFENTIQEGDKNYIQKLLEEQLEGHITIFDTNDISELATKNNPPDTAQQIKQSKKSIPLTMRLSAVLREFNISLDRAIEVLSSKGHTIEARPTTKITEEQYQVLFHEFQRDIAKKATDPSTERELKNSGFENISKKENLSEENSEKIKEILDDKATAGTKYADPYTYGGKFSDPQFKESSQGSVDPDLAEEQSQVLEDEEPELTRRQKVRTWLRSPEHDRRAFYVATSYWNGRDFTFQFLTTNTWFLESDTELPEFINNIEVGSIIFLRGQEDNTVRVDQLGIKTVGVVTHNGLDGKTLSVNWLLDSMLYHFEKLQNYKGRAIDIINEEDLETILTGLKEEDFNYISESLKTIPWVPSAPTIAGLISDADIGTDYLDISKDISAFARVMAAKSFLPPLAIALFGKWGSGKSFFMRKLREQIDVLASRNEETLFCTGIAQVHFNAWSYMDSNLWASMVTRIFEGLQQYIGNNTFAHTEIKAVEKALTEKLNITNEELDRLKNKKKVVDDRLISLESKKAQLEKELNEKIKALNEKTLVSVIEKVDSEFEVEKKITKAVNENPSVVKNLETFEEIVPRNYWTNPDALYEQTNSVSTFLRVFFDKRNWWKNIFWLLAIIVTIVIVPLGVSFIADLVGTTNLELSPEIWSIVTLLGGVGLKSAKTYNRLQPLVASFWEVKKEYHEAKEKATSNFYQEQKSIEMQIETFRREIDTINHQITITTQEKAEIQFRLENTLSTEALYNFIERKSESKDYTKHLGIISTIRKDFEILSELFTDHNNEVRKVKKVDAEEFRNYFERPLERIVLYIDDLDRCPEERVVEVLEAVNLLMAYPLFVVVVGVDPRWVKNALYKRHQLQFQELDDRDELELITPSTYLEKIFQVPFNLKSASDKSVKHMLKTLAETEPVLTEVELEVETEITSKIDEEDGARESKDISKDMELTDTTMSTSSETKIRNAPKSEVQEIKVSIESLVFSKNEINLIQGMSEVVGSSPRAIKRFINIFRIVKAHEDYPNTLIPSHVNVVLLMLALPIGKFKELYSPFIAYITEEMPDNNLESFFTNLENQSVASTTDKGNELYKILKKEHSDMLSTELGIFTKHYTLIRRFSYVID